MTVRLSATVNQTAAGLTAIEAELGQEAQVKVEAVLIDTLNNEQSTAIGGSASNQFVPHRAIVHLEDVGAGAAATGDFQLTMGTSAGGTQILPATAMTGVKDLNDRLAIAITGLTDPIAANSTLYVKVTTADSTAGAAHKVDVYFEGEVFTSGT